MKPLIETFGKNIRKQRTKQGISQEELSFKAGLSRAYIGRLERGEKNITLKNRELFNSEFEGDYFCDDRYYWKGPNECDYDYYYYIERFN